VSTNRSAGVVTPMPFPMGVIAETGETHAQLTDAILQHITASPAVVLTRSQTRSVLSISSDVDDPMDLSQTGWGVLFASDADPAIIEALQPLLDLRHDQVNSEQLFKVFAGPQQGVRPRQTAASWAAARGVSLGAPVRPRAGVPFYLLIVGSPDRIPFEFSALFDLQWAVGRLWFDDVAGFAAYASKVVDYEKGLAPAQKKRAALWMTRNPLDLATALLAGAVGADFLGQLPDTQPLGQRQGFSVSASIGDGQATKDRLSAILHGTAPEGAPAVLFAGSHGAEWSIADPVIQRARQGALVTQEWTRGQPLQPTQYFAAADLAANAQVHGLMAFLFACFAGGCPTTDSYVFTDAGAPIELAPSPFVAALPQRLLTQGALAVIGHVDRAFSYAFENVEGTPQVQLLRTPLELLMKGQRVGLAVDALNSQWASLAAQLGVALGGNRPGPNTAPLIANLFVARDDARNYLVLGDPAVCLRVKAMAT
jgi:hypothetical protein